MDYSVVLRDMPGHVKGFIHEDSTGYGTIVINSRLSHEEQQDIYKHELHHIKGNDFEKDGIQVIECAAHKGDAQTAGDDLGVTE